jgi:hypothetical protein
MEMPKDEWTRFDSVLTLKYFNQNLRPVMLQDIFGL